MFGQQDDQGQTQPTDNAPIDNHGAPHIDDSIVGTTGMHSDAPMPAFDQPAPADDAAAAQPSADEQWQHPGVPMDTPGPGVDVISPAGGFPKPAPLPPPASPAPEPVHHDNSAPVGDEGTQELLAIKQEALQKLMPIIDDIEQTPEEHFRTLMMMIQASDDDSLVPKAYEAAGAIEDEHTRAQALLDIVNEINYFTQPHEPQE